MDRDRPDGAGAPSSASGAALQGLRALTTRFVGEGRIEAVVLRPSRDAPARRVESARAEPGRGLLGDRRAETVRAGDAATRRELTLMQAEHLPLLAHWCGRTEVTPEALRRNLVVSGLNLVAMRSPFADVRLVWRIGRTACIEITGICDPCSKMEEALGPGAYNALRGHGGMTARVLRGGDVRVGDPVVLLAAGIEEVVDS